MKVFQTEATATATTDLIVGGAYTLGEFCPLGRAEVEEAPQQIPVQDVPLNVLQLPHLEMHLPVGRAEHTGNQTAANASMLSEPNPTACSTPTDPLTLCAFNSSDNE